jgi:hypothetical protein
MIVQRSALALPAIAVLRVSPRRPQRATTSSRGDETLLAAIQCPPRVSQVKALGDLLPGVLASYGLAQGATPPADMPEAFEAVA